VLRQFEGDIMQVPPEFSACKVDGKRAYLLMRKGRDVQLKAKPLHIDEIELLDFNPEEMTLSIRVVCGKGTYIRALARDIGQALDSGAFLTSLRRTRVGKYSVGEAVGFDEFPQWLEQVMNQD
jgi:tRNA pseudouridine55 synthase